MLQARLPINDFVAAAVARGLKLEGFFPEFTAEHLQKLFPRSGLYPYRTDMEVIKEGDIGRDLFVVYAGSVRVQKLIGTAVAQLAVLGPGEVLGEIALLRDGTRSASVVASVDSQIFRLAFEDLEYVLKHNEALGDHLRDLASRRI